MRWLRPTLFFVFSLVATLFPMLFGRLLWPDGLSAGLENMFWPASAVHLAGILRGGYGYFPLAAAGTFAAQLIASRPWDTSLINALGNAVEALVAAWAIRRWSGSAQPLGCVRGVLVFLAAAAFAPLCSSVPGVWTLVKLGWVAPADYGSALVVWNAANAVGIILLVPFLLSLHGEEWRRWRISLEWVGWLGIGFACGWVSFDAVFRSGGVNYAFLLFPFLIYAAVRFGPAQTAGALLLVLVFIYVTLMRVAPIVPVERLSGALWFTQSYCLVLGATALLLAAFTSERREAERVLRREQARVVEAGIRAERARLDALRYQINPHFLFNSLNSVRATLPLELAAPREMITRLADYLRATLYRNLRDRVPLEEELRLIGHYLDMEKVRFGDALQARIEADPAASGVLVPVLLLQPLVENAIRHGFEQSKGAFELRVRTRKVPGGVDITLANTGVWRPPASDGRRGLGLANVRRRLALIHRDSARFDVHVADGWVTLQLHIPDEPLRA